jgi:hypothetical protein
LSWRRAGQADVAPTEPSRNGRIRPDPALERRVDEELAGFEG